VVLGEKMNNHGAEQRLEQLFAGYGRLTTDSPAGERDGLLEAIDVTITAYVAAGLLSAEEAVAWRGRLTSLGTSLRRT
jgi:hypothetical protein